MVRAKFRLNKIETSEHTRSHPTIDGKYTSEVLELRTLIFSPVYSSDPESENRHFWDATPSGEIRLGCVNREAWEKFQLGHEYYLDFTPAPAMATP